MTFRLLTASALSLLLITSTSQAERLKGSFKAKPNQTIQLYWYSTFDKNCKPTNLKFRITEKPKYGKLSFRTENKKIRRVSSKSRENCIGKTLKATVVYYKAGNKRGIDKFIFVRNRNIINKVTYLTEVNIK